MFSLSVYSVDGIFAEIMREQQPGRMRAMAKESVAPPISKETTCGTIESIERRALELGFPVKLMPGYGMDPGRSFVVERGADIESGAKAALAASPTREVLVKKYIIE